MALFVALTVIVALAPAAMAKGGGQIGESFGTAGVGNGQFFNPGLLGVDNQDGTIYTGDYNGVLTSEASNIRIQQFSAGGEFKAAAEVKRYPEPTKAIGLVGIAVDHGLERIYMVETCRVATAGGTLSCKASQGKFAAKRILVFSTKAEGGKLVPDKTLPSIALPEGAQEIYAPKAIAIDPTNNDLVILAEENAGHKIVQRVSSGGTLGVRFTDTTDKLKPALGGGNGAFASTLAVSNTGVAYTLTGQKSPGSEQTRAWQLPQSLASLEEVPGFAAAAEKEGWPLGLESRVETGLGAPQLTISADGSTLYWKEYRTHSEGVEAGDLLVRGYSLSKKETTAIWGGGTSKCKITTSTSGVAAGASGNVTVFDFGAEVASVSGKPGYGLKVMTFGAGGSGCAEPIAKFTVNGKKEGEEISVKPGETVTFNAASSELLGGFRQELIWKFGDGGEKVVKGATEEAEAPTTTTYTYAAAAKVTAKLEIKLKKPPYGDPAPAERTFNVGTPVSGNKLTVTKSGTGTGTVTSSPAGINCGGDCEEEYSAATEVELTPAPAGGSTFKGWSGACAGTGSCKVTMSAAKSVNAEFAAIPSFTVKVKKGGNGTGTVTSSPAGINCGAACETSFTEGTAVTLSGAPGANAKAVVWSGCDSIVGANECRVTMSAAKEVTATFTLEQRQLTVTKSGTGTGTVTSTPAGINCGPTCAFSFDHGTSVTLAGAPGANTKAVAWSGCDSVNGSNECVVAMTAAKGVTAEFAAIPSFTLKVKKAGNGTGTVTSTPAGINCGPACEASFTEGTAVTLSGAPGANSKAVVWSGCDSIVGANECRVTMSAAKEVTATFTLEQRQLTVTKSGTGTGTVTSTPAGINCGPTCAFSFDHGTSVTLAGAPGANTKAVAWSGCDSVNGSNECVVAMTGAKAVTATFAPEQRQLTVTKSGTGTGTVTSTPAGINCGPTCSFSFDNGTEVTLTPAADSGSEFKEWTGACTGSGACKVTMSAAKSVDAKFALTPKPVTLKVKKDGTGSGAVSSTPAGISCGPTCEATFTEGTVVTLTANSSAGSKAVVWSGCGTVNGSNECLVTMSAAKEVTATFTLETRQLTVTKSGTGSGTVTSSPAGINCGPTCAASFDYGTEVTLTPAAGGGSEFKGWTGACTGTGSCKVTLTEAKSVDAEFALSGGPVSLTVKKTGSGAAPITSSPAGIDCRAACAANFPKGSVVTLTAALGANAKSVSWSGCDEVIAPDKCKVTLSAPRQVVADLNATSCTGANITGAGSSLQAIAHNSVWKPGFEGTICNTGTHPTITYNSIGSGAGLAEWNADGVKGSLNTGLAFIGTDDAPTATQINNIKSVAGGAETAIVPVAQTAIAIVAHPPAGCSLEGVSNGDLTAAFEGRRATWDSLEGAEGTCGSPITRVVRKDVSGTTFQLKNYLFQLYKKGLFCTTGIIEGKLSWQELANTAWPEACGEKSLTNLIKPAGNGGAEVVKAVNATAGSIGYAALPDAKANVSGTTAVLDMQNNGQKKGGEANYAPAASGNTANCSGISYQVPKLSGRRDIDWSGVFGAKPNVGGDNYPLCTLTYAVALHGYQAAGFSAGQATTVRDYLFGYIVQNSGQNAISSNYYNAIPSSADEKFDIRGAALRAAEAIG